MLHMNKYKFVVIINSFDLGYSASQAILVVNCKHFNQGGENKLLNNGTSREFWNSCQVAIQQKPINQIY